MAKAKKEDFRPSLLGMIAHRGLHDSACTENGLAAFSKAIEAGLDFELDIHLTKDDQLVVFHDSSLLRCTGKEGIIEELTLEELRHDYRLLDGETIPTYQEVLDLNQERRVIVTELKAYQGNHKKLGNAARAYIEEHVKDKSSVTVISFDPRALLAFGKGLCPRGLLLLQKRMDVFLTAPFFEYLDVEVPLCFDKRIIQYRRKGGLVNTWTVEDEETYQKVLPYSDMQTFQGFRREGQR